MNGQFDLGAITPARYFFGIAVVLGLLFGFTNTDDDVHHLASGLLQWQLQAVGIMACLVGAHVLLLRWSWFERQSPWLQLTLSGTLGSLVFAPAGALIDAWLGGEVVAEGTWLVEIGDEFLGIAPPAIFCWAAINAPWVMGFSIERRAEHVPVEAEESDSAEPKFFSLLPVELRGPVVFLQAELHYITVATVHGKALILYNLRDAVEELESLGISGLQCHRSFWVAEGFVESFRKKGRQGELQLATGATVPVSRRSMESVRARWAS